MVPRSPADRFAHDGLVVRSEATWPGPPTGAEVALVDDGDWASTGGSFVYGNIDFSSLFVIAS